MGHALDEPVERFVSDITGAIVRLARSVPGVQVAALPADVVAEAFAIVAAFVDADHNHTDDELRALISAFAGRGVPAGLSGVAPDDVRRAGLVVDKLTWIDTPSTLFDILVQTDARAGTADAWRYYEDAMQLAHTVCSLDDVPSSAELAAVDRFRGLLLHTMEQAGLHNPTTGLPVRTVAPPADATPSAPIVTATPATTPVVVPAEPLKPARPLEELLAELEGLVGLAEVKAEVRTVANLITVQNLRKARRLPVADQSRHLVFTGNPGTGKTTVARLLAEIYRTLQVVAKGQLVETDRAGLVAGFVGQTAARVVAVFEQALGGVLLVDEAYSLARGTDTDFGREAIDTLVKLVEDHREDIVVIAAGYPDEMADFINANPGLRSRFPKTIHFPDYSDDELVAIFRSLCDANAYTLDEEAAAAVAAWFRAQPREKGFGNGRLARNLFESCVARQASRLVTLKDPTDAQLCALAAEDVG